jgi:DNA primase
MQQEFIDQILQDNPIEQVMGEYVSLKRAGRNYVCLCPFHSEKSPSCTVFVETQSFYCFGCGVGGNVINFIKKIENTNFVESVEKLAKRCGLQMPEKEEVSKTSIMKSRILDINRETANFYYKNLLLGDDKRGIMYFSQRQLKASTIKKYGLGFAPDSWDTLYTHLHHMGYSDEELLASAVCKQGNKGKLYDTFRNRVMFPIVNLKGSVIGFGGRVLDDSKPKYLNSPQTLVFDKGSYCFSMNFAKNSPTRTLILAEGYMDVISINQAGFENVIATLGTAITPAQARLISEYADNVVVAYDSDTAGQKAAQKAINYFAQVGVKTSVLKMKGAKDPDEYIKKFGSERFKMLINNADDAIAFWLEKCKDGLDPESETDKAKLIKKSAQVLASISENILREVYISKVAKENSFDKDVLTNHVQAIRRKNSDDKKKDDWRQLTAQSRGINFSKNPKTSVMYTKEQKAQRELIYFLLTDNPESGCILENTDENSFEDELLKKVYNIIKEYKKENPDADFSLSVLSQQLDDDEMARVSNIIATNEIISKSREDVMLCLDIVKNENKKKINNENLSDMDIMEIINSKKNL